MSLGIDRADAGDALRSVRPLPPAESPCPSMPCLLLLLLMLPVPLPLPLPPPALRPVPRQLAGEGGDRGGAPRPSWYLVVAGDGPALTPPPLFLFLLSAPAYLPSLLPAHGRWFKRRRRRGLYHQATFLYNQQTKKHHKIYNRIYTRIYIYIRTLFYIYI